MFGAGGGYLEAAKTGLELYGSKRASDLAKKQRQDAKYLNKMNIALTKRGLATAFSSRPVNHIVRK